MMTFKESDQAKSGKTLRGGYVSFGHSVMLKLGSGESVEIDKGVIDLIKLMNSIPGIETKGSCQGQCGRCWTTFSTTGRLSRRNICIVGKSIIQ
jgi:hypothetical protein